LKKQILIRIFKKLRYDYNLTAFFLVGAHSSGILMENKLKVQWNINDSWAIKAGTLFTYGDYPYGKDYHLNCFLKTADN